MADSRVTPITRPNGKVYRPRKLTVAYCEEGACADASVLVLGTHDVVLAWPRAREEAVYRLSTEPDPHGTPGWWRDVMRNGERVWEYDDVRGRAGVQFEITGGN
jgi:hypothetical protein